MAMSTPPHPILKSYYQTDGERQSFVIALFDGAAQYYDRVGQLMTLDFDSLYRRHALKRAGLRPGMKLCDVAVGTGRVARSAVRILHEPCAVIGLDPSSGMLREARKALSGPLVQGRAEELPFKDDLFDMLSMGYALRHVANLDAAFQEYCRVLKPGGRLLILEISRPRSRVIRWLIRAYFQQVLPLIMRVATRSEPAELLMKYYWDTIDLCVPPGTILEVLRRSGFVDVEHRSLGGFVSEYGGVKARA